MKDYYNELEVSKTASKDVIEKVYKVLAKKYHPDTTQEIDKISSEEKFKAISEAYEILSDDEKRKKYDLELEQANPTVSYQEYINVINERDSLNATLNNLKNEFNVFKNSTISNQQYYTNSQAQYNQANSNFNNSNNIYTNYQNKNPNYSNQNTNTNFQRKKYYYTATGKPASAFAYFKYKIKEFLSNIFLLFLSIIAAIAIINGFFNLFF